MTKNFLKLDTTDDAWKALIWLVFFLTFVIWFAVLLLVTGPILLVITLVTGIEEGAILLLLAAFASFFNGYLNSMGVFWLLTKKKSGKYRYALFLEDREVKASFKHAYRFGNYFLSKWILYFIGVQFLGFAVQLVFSSDAVGLPPWMAAGLCMLHVLATLDGPFYVAARLRKTDGV